GGVFESGDGDAFLAFEVRQRSEAVVPLAGDELEPVDIVRPAEADDLLSIRRDFEAIHGEIDVAAFEVVHEVFESLGRVLDRPADLLGQCLGNVYFEANVAAIFALGDVGRAAFLVGAPAERLDLVVAAAAPAAAA